MWIRTSPDNVTTLADFTDSEVSSATTSCTNAGVQPGATFDDCVLDVLITGDVSYAESAAAVTGESIDPQASAFSPAGEFSEDFDAPVPTNVAFGRYLDDSGTTRVAGPVFDSAPYSAYVAGVPRHESVSLGNRPHRLRRHRR